MFRPRSVSVCVCVLCDFGKCRLSTTLPSFLVCLFRRPRIKKGKGNGGCKRDKIERFRQWVKWHQSEVGGVVQDVNGRHLDLYHVLQSSVQYVICTSGRSFCRLFISFNRKMYCQQWNHSHSHRFLLLLHLLLPQHLTQQNSSIDGHIHTHTQKKRKKKNKNGTR